MIISPSHTLEYKPNDIIITSSIDDVLLHHPKYRVFPGSTSKDLGGGASVLILTLALLRLLTAAAPRNAGRLRLPPRDCVSPYGHGASPSERSNARFSVALRDRPGHAGSGLPRRGSDLGVYMA